MNHRKWVGIGIASGILLIALGVGIALSEHPPAARSTPPVPATTHAPTTPTATQTPLPTATPEPPRFDGEAAYRHVLEQCGFGARPTGSINNQLLGDYLIARLRQYGWETEVQEFTYREVPGRNIVARRGQGPLVILGAHYDTRPYADYDPPETQSQHILGANDGGSGVAVLLELARVLDMERVPYEVRLLFFDAEDRGNLDGWPFSVGAEQYAAALDVEPKYVIVVDMVGDENQLLYWDGNSDPELNSQIWTLAQDLGYGEHFIPETRWQMIDDHLPFAKRGWPAIDIIDFDYPYWHTTQDTADKVRVESLARVGRVIQVFLEGAGA